MTATMAHRIEYVADEYTAKITPDALLARLRQSGFPVDARTAEDGVLEVRSGGVGLEVYVEDGFVAEIVVEVTFVNDRASEKLLELLESMGWLPVDDAGGE